MKQRFLLLAFMGVYLILGLSACSEEDKSVFGDDFEVPELTDANTIQFTIDATGEWKALQIIGEGGKMAIEWGDGRLQKVVNADANPVIRYKYRNSRKYRVRIWAEELTFCSVGDVIVPFCDLRLGYLPKMKTLKINSFLDTQELDLSTSCPNVETINIGTCADLERINLSQCAKIQAIEVYSNPKLSSLQLGKLPELTSINCVFNDALTSLSFKGAISLNEVQCGFNPQLSTIETDEHKYVKSLLVSNCAFRSLSFINSFPFLQELRCNSNLLTSLDISGLSRLQFFNCSGNRNLAHLQIPEQERRDQLLQDFDCSFCNLNERELNTIFDILPVAYNPFPQYPSSYDITFNGNPGAEKCDWSTIKNKGWNIFENSGELINR